MKQALHIINMIISTVAAMGACLLMMYCQLMDIVNHNRAMAGMDLLTFHGFDPYFVFWGCFFVGIMGGVSFVISAIKTA